jgi:hypothetical protein
MVVAMGDGKPLRNRKDGREGMTWLLYRIIERMVESNRFLHAVGINMK